MGLYAIKNSWAHSFTLLNLGILAHKICTFNEKIGWNGKLSCLLQIFRGHTYVTQKRRFFEFGQSVLYVARVYNECSMNLLGLHCISSNYNALHRNEYDCESRSYWTFPSPRSKNRTFYSSWISPKLHFSNLPSSLTWDFESKHRSDIQYAVDADPHCQCHVRFLKL